MIGYVMLGTNDYERALSWYDTVLGVIGGKRAMDFGSAVAYGFAQGPFLCVTKPHDGLTATNGNGTMVALNVGSKENVDKLHKVATDLGAQCEGPPGARSENFYAAYFRDLDGNKLCAFVM